MAAAQTPGQSSAVVVAGRYRVVARVGLGGTAVVYRCVDEHTGRMVAVKVLRTTGPQIPEAAGRFRREARLAASLSHPHIVRVLDYGYTMPLAQGARTPWSDDEDQPVPYVAMEYVFGPNVKELVRRHGQLPLSWIWQLGEQLCAALDAAHSVGVVHRDVKPQNVMLVDSHIEILAKLTDFGIARQIGGDYTTLTVTGQVLGTPDYLSPEQVMGEPGDERSDLYSLGIVLYELVTARLPFEADTPLAAASRRMVTEPPPPNRFRPDVPPALQDMIMMVLKRDPTARPTSARELAAALRWIQAQSAGMPESARGAWLLDPRKPPPGDSAAGSARERRTPPDASAAHGAGDAAGAAAEPNVPASPSTEMQNQEIGTVDAAQS